MSKLRNVILVILMLALVRPALADDATPAATAAAGSGTLISLSSSKDLGKFLVGKDGLTLYTFTPDPLNNSVCYDKCAFAWPPLLVDSADKITVADGIPGKFSAITRKDGKLQVAYNGMALYYWFKDVKAGDTTGQRVDRAWWVVPPATVYGQNTSKLGTILVGSTGMTVYTFSKDTANTSTCYDACAQNWPPVTVKSADDFIPGLNLLGKFDTTKRTDGTLQVTYNGMPLYYFKKDAAVGDTNGEGVGSSWYSVVPETVGVSTNKDLGDLLITADGMTLYTSASACTDNCTKNWKAYTIGMNDRLKAAASVTGKLDTVKLDSGGLQVTYNGAPLFVSTKDKNPGDANGAKVDAAWTLVKP
jgi:predicted lipoprotein with Yx(FWY)xxD motif